MKVRLNPLILGAFIVGAAVLAVVAFLALGSANVFQPTGHFIVYLSGSAQGVGDGTAVNLEGVRVGQVEGVRVLYDRKSRRSFVGVICRINENRLTDIHGKLIRLTDRHVLQNLITNGLYAQIQNAGIVGAKYIELGFRSSSIPTVQNDLPPSKFPVVPTIPSTMSKVTDNISQILSNLREIDFQGIARQVNEAIVSARRQISELETNRLAARFSAAAMSFGNFMNSTNLNGAVVRLREAASSFETLATNLNAQVEPLGTNLNTSLSSARQSVQELQDFLKLRNQLGVQTRDLMTQFDRTARAIQQLADFLERHPNALITGRSEQSNSP